MKGTTPKGADVSAWVPAVNDFWVAKGNPALTDFNYAAEAYDAVTIVIALAVRAGAGRRHRLRREDQRHHQGRREVHRLTPTAWRSSRPAATPTTTASPVRSTSTATASR